MPLDPLEARETRDALTEKSSYRKLYLLLFVCGFVLRFGFVLIKKTYERAPGSILPFGLEICSIAQHIVEGKGYSSPFSIDTGPTAWIAPVYPYLAALVFKLFGIYSQTSAIVLLGIQCILGAATSVLIHALGRRTLGVRIGFWAAWIWAVSPIFFRWPTSWIWDFTASAFLFAAIFIVTLDTAEKNTRKQWLALGTVWAVAALTNPALISVLPFSFLYAIYVNHHAHRQWLASAVLSAACFAVLVSPWLIRNDLVFGKPVFFRSNFWFEFHLGNYHFSNGFGYSGKHPTANAAELKKYAAMGEMAYLDYYKQDGLRFVREYPGEFVDLTLHRTLWFWDGTHLLYQSREWWKPWEFWPLSVAAWLGFLFVLTRRPRGTFLFASYLVVYPAPYYFVYPVAKYRHAIEPELLLLSVYLFFVIVGEVRAFRSRKQALPAR